MIHRMAGLVLLGLLMGLCICSPMQDTPPVLTSRLTTSTLSATTIPTFFPTTVTLTSNYTTRLDAYYRPPFLGSGVMSREATRTVISSLIQEWPNRPSTIPFSITESIIATTIETWTVRAYPNGPYNSPDPYSETHSDTTSTTFPAGMHAFSFSLTKFPTTLKSTYTSSTSGETVISTIWNFGPPDTKPLPSLPLTVQTVRVFVETVTEVWASRPTSLPYTLTQQAEATVTEASYTPGETPWTMVYHQWSRPTLVVNEL